MSVRFIRINIKNICVDWVAAFLATQIAQAGIKSYPIQSQHRYKRKIDENVDVKN